MDQPLQEEAYNVRVPGAEGHTHPLKVQNQTGMIRGNSAFYFFLLNTVLLLILWSWVKRGDSGMRGMCRAHVQALIIPTSLYAITSPPLLSF